MIGLTNFKQNNFFKCSLFFERPCICLRKLQLACLFVWQAHYCYMCLSQLSWLIYSILCDIFWILCDIFRHPIAVSNPCPRLYFQGISNSLYVALNVLHNKIKYYRSSRLFPTQFSCSSKKGCSWCGELYTNVRLRPRCTIPIELQLGIGTTHRDAECLPIEEDPITGGSHFAVVSQLFTE